MKIFFTSLWDIIDLAYFIESQTVTGKFYMKESEIKKFVYFVLIANYKQSLNESRPIIDICVDKHYDSKYKNMKSYELIEDKKFKNYYEQQLDHFHKYNYSNKIRSESRKGNIRSRYEGNRVFDFQMHEFDVLEYFFYDITYKRIRSNKHHNIKYEEYFEFVNALKDDIKQSDNKYKNVQLYKLERKFFLELIKSILIVINKTKPVNRQKVIKDLLLTTKIPEIDTRQRYVKVYEELSEEKRVLWVNEINGLVDHFLKRLIKRVNILIDTYNLRNSIFKLTEFEEKTFSRIYADKKYCNDYKIDKDFKNIHFKKLMIEIEKYNNNFERKENA